LQWRAVGVELAEGFGGTRLNDLSLA
jgi:hypothetical protein